MGLGTKILFHRPKHNINMNRTSFCGPRATGVEMVAGETAPGDFAVSEPLKSQC